ncbi:hypothetical protein [Streptacidiphilus sp. PAMC 29251]
MAESEAVAAPPALELGSHWRPLVTDWAARSHYRSTEDAASVSLDFDLTGSDRRVTLRFMTTTSLLVAFMTDGHTLRPDQLALAAAASNAWNTEQLVPMLSVWDVRGPNPCLAGVCVLPLTCRMTRQEFGVLAEKWADHARQMFTRCHRVFQL